MGIGIRFGLGPVSVGAGMSFRSRRSRSTKSDGGNAEFIAVLMIIGLVAMLILATIVGAIGALIGLLYVGARPRQSFAAAPAFLFFGLCLLMFIGGIGVDVVAVRYFLEVGSSQLTPNQVILAGVGVGVALLGAIVFFIWLLRRIRASLGGVGWRGWLWILSAVLVWVSPLVVLGRWTSLQDEDVNVVAQFAIVLLLISGFLFANVVTHVSNPQDAQEGAGLEVTIESDDLASPRVLRSLTRIVTAGDRHKGLVQFATPLVSGGICLILAYLLELLPNK